MKRSIGLVTLCAVVLLTSSFLFWGTTAAQAQELPWLMTPSEYFDEAVVHLQLGALNQAFDDFTHAIELEPNFGLAYVGRSVTCLLLGEFRLAFLDLVKVVALMEQVFAPA